MIQWLKEHLNPAFMAKVETLSDDVEWKILLTAHSNNEEAEILRLYQLCIAQDVMYGSEQDDDYEFIIYCIAHNHFKLGNMVQDAYDEIDDDISQPGGSALKPLKRNIIRWGKSTLPKLASSYFQKNPIEKTVLDKQIVELEQLLKGEPQLHISGASPQWEKLLVPGPDKAQELSRLYTQLVVRRMLSGASGNILKKQLSSGVLDINLMREYFETAEIALKKEISEEILLNSTISKDKISRLDGLVLLKVENDVVNVLKGLIHKIVLDPPEALLNTEDLTDLVNHFFQELEKNNLDQASFTSIFEEVEKLYKGNYLRQETIDLYPDYALIFNDELAQLHAILAAIKDASKIDPDQTAELTRLISDVLLHSAPMLGLVPTNQAWLTERMRACGYSEGIDISRGVCYGIAHMALQAYLAKDMARFYTRLRTIYNATLMECVPDEQGQILAGFKKRLTDEGQDPDHINQQIIDIQAFFEGVILNQNPDKYNDFFVDEHRAALIQQGKRTMQGTLSLALDKNKPVFVSAWSGAYDKQELVTYLTLLQQRLGHNQSFSLQLMSNLHETNLNYDHHTQQWLFIDPNQLPGTIYTSPASLAGAILKSHFSVQSQGLVMQTELYTCESDATEMIRDFEAIKQTEPWQILHALSEEKVNKTYLDDSKKNMHSQVNSWAYWGGDMTWCAQAYEKMDNIRRRELLAGIKEDDQRELRQKLGIADDAEFPMREVLSFNNSEKKTINGVSVTIHQESEYPIPWPKDKARPQDYYERLHTVIEYGDMDQMITINIPKTEWVWNEKSYNRRRVLTGSIMSHGVTEQIELADNYPNILDMAQTFDIQDMEKLMRIVDSYSTPLSKDGTLRARLPFYFAPQAAVTPEDIEKYKDTLHLDKTHGGEDRIQNLVSPYIEAMKLCGHQKKEIYIPVVTLGAPHHWTVCVLTLDEQNKPSLTYLESSAGYAAQDASYHIFREGYEELYRNSILDGVNKALEHHELPKINQDDIFYDVSKQFSEEGCGIAASITMQQIMQGEKKVEGIHLVDFNKISTKEKTKSYSGVSIEEDAMRRVQLALKLRVDPLKDIPPKHKEKFSIVMRELDTHRHSLTARAQEVFIPVTSQSVKNTGIVQTAEPLNKFDSTSRSISPTSIISIDHAVQTHLNHEANALKEMPEDVPELSVKKINTQKIIKARISLLCCGELGQAVIAEIIYLKHGSSSTNPTFRTESRKKLAAIVEALNALKEVSNDSLSAILMDKDSALFRSLFKPLPTEESDASTLNIIHMVLEQYRGTNPDAGSDPQLR